MITRDEFEAILADRTKRVEIDLRWRRDQNHWPALTFRAPVLSDGEHLIEVVGRWNPMAGKLSYVLLRRGTGRIYGLDMGKEHGNPGGERVGETHKHHWTNEFRDEHAYPPPDITAPWDRPLEVWAQFRAEARIEHRGRLYNPDWQEALSL